LFYFPTKQILVIGAKLIDIIIDLAKTFRVFLFQHRWFFNDVTLWTDTFVMFKPQDSLFYEKFTVLEGARKNVAADLAFPLSRVTLVRARVTSRTHLRKVLDCSFKLNVRLKSTVTSSETVRSLVLRLD